MMNESRAPSQVYRKCMQKRDEIKLAKLPCEHLLRLGKEIYWLLHNMLLSICHGTLKMLNLIAFLFVGRTRRVGVVRRIYYPWRPFGFCVCCIRKAFIDVFIPLHYLTHKFNVYSSGAIKIISFERKTALRCSQPNRINRNCLLWYENFTFTLIRLCSVSSFEILYSAIHIYGSSAFMLWPAWGLWAQIEWQRNKRLRNFISS